jgi:hypothetical protein
MQADSAVCVEGPPVMPILKTRVENPQNGTLNEIDTIEYRGRPWLVVGGWRGPDDKGHFRPAGLIRPVNAEFQAGGWRGSWADYFLKVLISAAVIDGSEPAPPEQFEIVESPDLKVELPSLRGPHWSAGRRPR